MNNKKISQFVEVSAIDETTYIPIIQGAPLFNAVIKPENLLPSISVEEAPIDGNEYVRKDGTWVINTGEEQIQSDWNQTDDTQKDYIKNKPIDLVQDNNYIHTDNNLTDELVTNYDEAYNHSLITGNPHNTSFSNISGYPEISTGKVLFDDKTFKEFVQAGGASNQPIYMLNEDSDIVGYKALSYTQGVNEYIKTITANNSTVSGEAYLFNLPIGTTIIPGGTYEFGYWRSVSSAVSDSFKQIELFIRNPDGSEQSLITFESASIEDTIMQERMISRTTASSFTVNPLGRLGVRSKFRTNRNRNVTLSYIIGDGKGWWMKSPLPTRHDLLRDKNGNLAFQHLDTSITKNTPINSDSIGLWDSENNIFVKTGLESLKTYMLGDINTIIDSINGEII